MSNRPLDAQVLVVGGGPTGLLAANLLGTLGLSVLLVEQHAATSNDAKAISLDDESMRSLQLADLDQAVYSIIVPGTGTKYFGARGQPLVHVRGPGPRSGHPFKNPFAQPEFERVLRDGLNRFPHVRQEFSTTLTTLDDVGDTVRVQLDGPRGTRTVRTRFVLGCDGGRSTVRELLGVAMTGRSHDDVWLVVDTLGDLHDERFGMHHGDPSRPHLLVPGRDGRCRYEFLLRPDEVGSDAAPPFELVRNLLSAYRPIRPEQVERAVTYRFHALLADRFRVGSVFLLGDAAHMMPPFAGQGLNSGVRDATNLAWKIAEAASGDAGDALLDTYEAERRPHARATIDFSEHLGALVFTTSRRRAAARDAVVGALMRTAGGRRYLTTMRYRPAARFSTGAVVTSSRLGRNPLVGRVLEQPVVLLGESHRRARLDDALGRGWTVLGVAVEPSDWRTPGLARLPGRQVDVLLDDRAVRTRATPDDERIAITDADGDLNTLFDDCRACFVVVRPDRVVAAVTDPAGVPGVVASLRAAGVAVDLDGDNLPVDTAAPPSALVDKDRPDSKEYAHETRHHPPLRPHGGSSLRR